ncbi:hypothetical protein TIFTF001_014379 [Ficus carica]|uniref:Uncharacterized protein n=1 Tax=Ficus carica TaxID=3494 RepID=A0AA88DIF7_FICCA|nr:hypothetical protein TIFTF001_014379 [Ficus carica]
MFSLSPNRLPPTIADRFARQVADYATDAAQRRDFTASRLLPINVGISTFTFYTSSNDHVDRLVERAVRGIIERVSNSPRDQVVGRGTGGGQEYFGMSA